jgi:hypothetical protein
MAAVKIYHKEKVLVSELSKGELFSYRNESLFPTYVVISISKKQIIFEARRESNFGMGERKSNELNILVYRFITKKKHTEKQINLF